MTTTLRRIAAISALALIVTARLAGQPAPLAGFDEWTAAAVGAWRVPGLAVAVVKDGNVVFARGYGVRELGKTDPVDTRTLFAIGSTTKAMTAALVGMLVDDQKLGWDDPVAKHLPSFQLKDPAVTRELTVRDLLTHRAGLGNADYLSTRWHRPARSGRASPTWRRGCSASSPAGSSLAASLALDQYAGSYRDALRGDVSVTFDGSALRLQYGPGFSGTLEHWHYNTFRARWAAEWRQPALVTFDVGAGGQADALELMNGRFARRPAAGAGASGR